jgi:hypothetical protein
MQNSLHRYKFFFLSILFGYLIIIVLRDPRFFISPRFWAEEGTYHFANSYTLPWLQALIIPVQGYLNFWPNLSTLIASRVVPLEEAPLVTTLMAFLVQAALGAWIVTTSGSFGSKLYQKIAMLLIILFVPLTGEMWLNTINSMEVFCVLTFLILIEPTPKKTLRGIFGYILILLGGLTGLYSLLLTPFFFIKAWIEKSRARLAQGLILVVCGLIQAFLIFASNGMGSLGFRLAGVKNFNLRTIVEVLFSQSMGLIVSGLNQMRTIVYKLESIQASNVTASRLIALSLLILEISFLLYLVIKHPRKESMIYAGSYLWMIVALVFFSIDRDKSVYIQPGYGQRHFFAPNIILGFLILASIDWSPGERWRFRSLFASVVLGTAIVFGITQFQPTLYRYPGWPSWPAQVTAWRSNPNYNLIIWPDPWVMNPLHPPH